MIRDEVIDLRGSTQTQRKELYKVLKDLEEPIYENTSLTLKNMDYDYYCYNGAKWSGGRSGNTKEAINIQDFISKYKKKEPKSGDIMSTIKVGDVYLNSSGKTCTITSTLINMDDSPTGYTYKHQDGNTYAIGINTIQKSWTKCTKRTDTTSLYDRLVTPNTAVHCKTEDEAKQLLNWAHNQGLKWRTNKSYQANTNYNKYSTNTCYELATGEFAYFDFFKSLNYTIIPFSSIPEFQSKEKEAPTMTIKNLPPGTKVRVRDDLKENKTYYTTDSKNYSRPNNVMLTFRGKIVTIKTQLSSGAYTLENGPHFWTDGMFSEIITTPEEKQETQIIQPEPIQLAEEIVKPITKLKYKIGDYVTLSPTATQHNIYNGVKFTNFSKFSEPLLVESFDTNGVYYLSNGKKYGQDILVLADNMLSIQQNSIEKNQTVAQQEPIKSKSIKKEESFMSKLKATALTTVDQNKEAAIIAAKMEAGRVINKQVIKQAAKHVPFWAKGYLDTPLAPVVLANAVAMLGNHTGNAKVQKVSELMLLAAADVTVQSFNLDKIIDDVLSGIKLPAGILDDVE